MIKTEQVDNEIDKLQKDLITLTKQKPKDEKDASKIGNKITRIENKIDYYNGVRRYLESRPTEDFMRSEVSRVATSIKGLDDKYDYWVSNVRPKNLDPKNWRSKYNSDTGYTKLKNQAKTLDYILNG